MDTSTIYAFSWKTGFIWAKAGIRPGRKILSLILLHLIAATFLILILPKFLGFILLLVLSILVAAPTLNQLKRVCDGESVSYGAFFKGLKSWRAHQRLAPVLIINSFICTLVFFLIDYFSESSGMVGSVVSALLTSVVFQATCFLIILRHFHSESAFGLFRKSLLGWVHNFRAVLIQILTLTLPFMILMGALSYLPYDFKNSFKVTELDLSETHSLTDQLEQSRKNIALLENIRRGQDSAIKRTVLVGIPLVLSIIFIIVVMAPIMFASFYCSYRDIFLNSSGQGESRLIR